MKLPSGIDRISLNRNFAAAGLYPPPGFIPFFERQLGNGDTFGLYWPIGLEDHEPIVAEARHDGWQLVPVYSTLEAFLAESERIDEDELLEPQSLDSDPRSPFLCLNAARQNLATQNIDQAVSLLETAVAVLPEFTDALSILASQYIRLGKIPEACAVAIRAIISPPCFGERPVKLLHWLRSQKDAPAGLHNDPIWAIRGDLRLVYGGSKENSDYRHLMRAIDGYLDQSQWLKALTLLQTYGELMSAETVAFQQRYGFKVGEFKARQLEISAWLPGGPRRVEL